MWTPSLSLGPGHQQAFSFLWKDNREQDGKSEPESLPLAVPCEARAQEEAVAWLAGSKALLPSSLVAALPGEKNSAPFTSRHVPVCQASAKSNSGGGKRRW